LVCSSWRSLRVRFFDLHVECAPGDGNYAQKLMTDFQMTGDRDGGEGHRDIGTGDEEQGAGNREQVRRG